MSRTAARPRQRDDHYFKEWREAVETHVIRLAGCRTDDLPDYDFWAAFWANTTPLTAARDLLKRATEF